MALKQETKKINGRTYQVTQVDAVQSLAIFRRIQKHLGYIVGSIGFMSGGAVKSAIAAHVGSDSDVDGGDGGSLVSAELASSAARPAGIAIERVSKVLSDDDFNDCIDKLWTHVDCDGREVNAEHWRGHFEDYYEALLFTLRVNFGAAFLGVSGPIRAAIEAGLREFQSPSTSAPSSPLSSRKEPSA